MNYDCYCVEQHYRLKLKTGVVIDKVKAPDSFTSLGE
jgi:hypothetical protein